MMKIEQWLEIVKPFIKEISDLDYQQKNWFSDTEVLSSFNETICGLYDEALFEDFIESYSSVTSKERAKKLAILNELLDSFIADLGEDAFTIKMLKSKQWLQIVNHSKDCVNSL